MSIATQNPVLPTIGCVEISNHCVDGLANAAQRFVLGQVLVMTRLFSGAEGCVKADNQLRIKTLFNKLPTEFSP
jgi:hypothetical protein